MTTGAYTEIDPQTGKLKWMAGWTPREKLGMALAGTSSLFDFRWSQMGYTISTGAIMSGFACFLALRCLVSVRSLPRELRKPRFLVGLMLLMIGGVQLLRCLDI